MWSCAPLCLSRRVTVDSKPTNNPPPPTKNQNQNPLIIHSLCALKPLSIDLHVSEIDEQNISSLSLNYPTKF